MAVWAVVHRGQHLGVLPAGRDVPGHVVPLVGELGGAMDDQGVQVGQRLHSLERHVVADRVPDLDAAEDHGGDGRDRDDRDEPPADSPVAQREARPALNLCGGAASASGRVPGAAAHGRYGHRQTRLAARSPGSLPGVTGPAEGSGTGPTLTLADAQRSTAQRTSPSAARKAGSRRLRTAVSVGHRSSTHCAHTSQLQEPPGPAPGNERLGRSSSGPHLSLQPPSNDRRRTRSTG